MSDLGPIGDLKRQHGVLSAEMNGLAEAVRGLGPATSREEMLAIGERLEAFREALNLHLLREEQALFPEARQLLAASAPAARPRRPPARPGGPGKADVLGQFLEGEGEDDMRAHSLLAARVEQISRLLAGQINEEARGKMRALVSAMQSLLGNHAAKEDGMIFPLIERALTQEQKDWVWERMKAVTLTGEPGEGDGGAGMRRLGE